MIRSVSIREFVEGQYLAMRPDLTEGSAKQLRTGLNLFERWLGRAATFSDLRRDNVLQWMRWLSDGRSPATVNSKRRAIIAIWNAAAEDGLCEPPGKVAKVREPRRIPVAWTLQQINRIFAAVSELPGEWSGVPVSLCWRIGLLVFWDTGSRLQVILKAHLDHVDLDAQTLFVPAEHLKGRKADRLFVLHEQTIDAIRQSLPSSREFLFPFPWQPCQMQPHLKRILKSAGLPSDSKRMFHCFRRTVSSLAAAQRGVEFSAAAIGHSVDVAKRSYISPLIYREPSLIDALPRPHTGNGECRQLRLF